MSVKTTLRVGALSAVLAAAMAISACGTSGTDRAVSGGLIGAGVGTAIGSVTGSNVTGAIIGGIGGATIGAATAPRLAQAHCLRVSPRTGQCVEAG